ncbi:MAG: recombinase family protein [Candidatus Limnocylindrales bacterium]|jgi:DNA invertase Pin-like site-specific DNA recombinase
MRTPVAYIRKSRVFDERAGVSWEVQEAKVRELAAQYGDNGGRLLILSDWNVSGRKGTAARPGYRRLVAMIEADEAAAVYSYNLARLSRSVQDLRALMALADAHGAPVRLVADHVDTSTATGRMLLTILAAVDEMTADLASEHARDAVAARRARGDHIGHPFYGERPGEDANAVIAAFREAGTVMGAARLLNGRKLPTRQGGLWSNTSVRAILLRFGALPPNPRPGVKARAPYVLYGILRCHCGHVLTGTRYKNGSNTAYCAYKCHEAREVSNHGLGAVPEKRILPWIKAEAARLRLPETVTIERERQAERDKLNARKARIADMYETNTIKRDDYQKRMAALKVSEDTLEALEAATAVLDVPQAIDWEHWTPEAINKVLAAMWSSVTMDEHMEPIKAIWRRPEWRG